MAAWSPAHNDSGVYLRNGQYRTEQTQKENVLGLTELGKGNDDGNSDCSFGDWASSSNLSTDKQYLETWHQILRHAAIRCCTWYWGTTWSHWYFYSNCESDRDHSEYAAVRNAKKMTGILMGAKINDHYGRSLILVILDVSVYDPGMSGSLILAECLMEARYSLISVIFSRVNSLPLHSPSIGVALLLKTISQWWSWSMQDTHHLSDCRKSESHRSHRLCVWLYLRTPKTSNSSNISTCNSSGIFDWWRFRGEGR